MTGIVIAGMHRSGTSLLTHLFAAGGWHPGEEVLASEAERYAEDATFVDVHRKWLEACLPVGDGHRDWGVSDGGGLDLDALPAPMRQAMTAEALSFTERRDRERVRWVAKDPRASLFLPVWAEIESLRFVLVYRNPWDVVDSAVRLGADVFCRQPRIALRAWLDHNRRLAAFAAAHRDRCFVLAAERITLDPSSVWEAVRDRFGLDGDVPDDLLAAERFVRRDDRHPIADLYRSAHPVHCAVLADLDRLADIPRVGGDEIRSFAADGESAVQGTHRAATGGSLPMGTGVQVIIPCRNDGDFILEAIASVDECARRASVHAGRDRVEVTVVDDGSTDPETQRILDVLRTAGRQVIAIPASGLPVARNAALAASATGAVVALDADNRVRYALIEALDVIERGEADIVHGPWRRFGMDRSVVEPPMMTLDALVPGNTIDACALVSRALLERLGGWDPLLPYWEDWDLWLGAVGAGAQVRRLDAVTFDYLVRPQSLSVEANRDSHMRERVVRSIIAKHIDLLGPTMGRLIVAVHELNTVISSTEAQRRELELAYRRLEAQWLELEHAYREFEAHHLEIDTAYRAVETARSELQQAYRNLEQHHLGVESEHRALEAAYRALEDEYLRARGES